MSLQRKSKMYNFIKNYTHDAGIELFRRIKDCSVYTQKEIYELSKEYLEWYESKDRDKEWNDLFKDETEWTGE